jgi:hypothetical protein
MSARAVLAVVIALSFGLMSCLSACVSNPRTGATDATGTVAKTRAVMALGPE